MKLSKWTAVSLLALGCAANNPTPTATPSSSASTTASSSSATAATGSSSATPAAPNPLADVLKGRTVTGGPFAWPKGGSSALVDDSGTVLVWRGPSGQGERRLPGAVAKVVTKDVTKDGDPELVLFAKPSSPPNADEPSTWIFGINPATKKPARMWKREIEVLGASDEASLDRELAAVTTFAVDKNTPAPKIIARLGSATPDQMKALVGPKGVKLCTRQGSKSKCVDVATSTIDAKMVGKIAGQAGGLADFEPDPDGDHADMNGLMPPNCSADSKNAKRLLCFGGTGEPSGGEWIFEQTPTGLRLAEAWSWAEDS